MFGLGTTELLVVLGILILLFGARKLPDLGQGLGKGIRSFRKALKGHEEDDGPPSATGTSEGPPSSSK
jgi:sec-independent protein translocase protein TatA